MVSTAGEGGDARARASGVAGAARAQLGRGHGGGSRGMRWLLHGERRTTGGCSPALKGRPYAGGTRWRGEVAATANGVGVGALLGRRTGTRGRRGGSPASRRRELVEAVRGGRGRVGDGGGVDYGGEVEAARSPGGGGAAHSDGADVQGRRACCPFPIQIGSGKRGEGEGEPERRRRGGRRGEGADAREGIGRGEILSPARCVRACLCVCVVWWRRVRETRGRWGS